MPIYISEALYCLETVSEKMIRKLKDNLKNRQVSITTRITSVTLVFVVLITIIASSFSYLKISSLIDSNIAENMNLIAENQGLRINQIMFQAEIVATYISSYIQDQITGSDDLKDDAIREYIIDSSEEAFVAPVQGIEYALSCYLFFGPDYLEGKEDGFLYFRNENEDLKKVPLTDILLYEPDDIEHVGWYYIPKEAGEAVWIPPYRNQNLDTLMISYVVPVINNNEFICIVGIDIDFNSILNDVDEITTAIEGSAYLSSDDWKSHYHAVAENDSYYIETLPANVHPTFEMRLYDSSTYAIRTHSLDNNEEFMSFVTLRNGMKLVVYVDSDDAYSDRYDTLAFLLVLSCVIGIVFIAFSIVTARFLSRPIKVLTSAAKKIGSGDFNITLPDSNIKEIEILSDTLRLSADNLSKFTKNMEDLIYKDDLTHVKNKAAYTLAVDTIQHKIETEPEFQFGVAMFDLNFLKSINDKYGHEAGDIAIKTCCKIICEVFEHSPVFRIGGDEFVAILTGKDYEIRAELEKELIESIQHNKQSATHIYEAVSIAYGIAVYNPEKDPHYINVFSRADNEMYNCKKKDHEEVGTTPR